jgi:hypothetical protein
MPFALVLIGLALILSSARDTYVALGNQVRSDFIGPGGYLYWAGSIGMAGAIGYVPQLRRLSIALMGLILLVLLLKHSDFFSKFTAGMRAGPAAPKPTGASATPAGAGGSSNKSPISAIIPFASGAIPGVNELPDLPSADSLAQYAPLVTSPL